MKTRTLKKRAARVASLARKSDVHWLGCVECQDVGDQSTGECARYAAWMQTLAEMGHFEREPLDEDDLYLGHACTPDADGNPWDWQRNVENVGGAP